MAKKLKNLDKALGVRMELGWSYVTRPQQIDLKGSERKSNIQLAEKIVISIKERATINNSSRKADSLVRRGRDKFIVLLITRITIDTVKLPKLSTKFRINQRDTHKNHGVHPISHTRGNLGRHFDNVISGRHEVN